MKFGKLLKTPVIVIACLSLSAPARADNKDLVHGLMGAMIGAAIATQKQSQSNSQPAQSKTRQSKQKISSQERTANKLIQEHLNYFGFDTGRPDGVLGRKSRTAVSQFQACLNFPISGTLNSFEKQFLHNTAYKAQASPQKTLRDAAKLHNGYCGVLQKHLAELSAPDVQTQTAAVATTTVVNPAPVAPQVAPQATTQQATVSSQSAQPVVPKQPVNITNNVTNAVVQRETTNVYILQQDLQKDYDRLVTQIKLVDQILDHIKASADTPSAAKKLKAVELRLEALKALVVEKNEVSESQYGTPIRPSNANLGITAAKASEVFPRVPYYQPGTEEIGELWIKPYVSDVGELLYDLNFVAEHSDFDKIQDTVQLTQAEISMTSQGLAKVSAWSDKALEKGLRRRYEKAATCFPAAMCDSKEVGKSSTEIMFMIYQDGSTSASIRLNKGRFQKSYNLSVESGLLLAAYSDYMDDIGSKEFQAATMSDTELDSMFE